MIYKLASGTNDVATIHAARGKLEVNSTNQTYVMHLYDVNGIRFNGDRAAPISGEYLTESFPVGERKRSDAIPISDMTFGQLRVELRDLENKLIRTNSGVGQPALANEHDGKGTAPGDFAGARADASAAGVFLCLF